jgi:hypothetical protein
MTELKNPFKPKDKLELLPNSPLWGTIFHVDDYEVESIIDHEKIMVRRNNYHSFESMNLYFKLKP